MEAQIQIRRSTAAQWISANPILAPGEPGVETDTGKGKYGDGAKAWTALGYSWQLLSVGPSGPAGGSLAGTYPNPSLAPNSVGTAQIIDGSVGTDDLTNLAVTSPKLADLAVTAAKIADAQVINAKLGPSAVTTDKILDGTIGLGDLSPAALDALQLDVADEGGTVQADATRINFVGAGVTAVGAGGVATVTIPGGDVAGALLAGTIASWYDPTPPVGWYLCDGTVKADMAGTLGTRYGATPGTLPFIQPVLVDLATGLISDVISSTQPGWQINTVNARRVQNHITIFVQATRTGATIPFANPGHADQTVAVLKSAWAPEFTVSAATHASPEWMAMTAAGSLLITSGFASLTSDNCNIIANSIHMATLNFPATPSAPGARTYSIIKAP